jgi:prolipoprotein diacylglyceryltransferase
MGGGVLAGGFWVRLGCVFNGCCVGRATNRWYGIELHDVTLVRKRRIPVQFLEMGWWLLGLAIFCLIWPHPFPMGTYALGTLGWYGCGRFWLEPLRESPDLVLGRIRINQLVAAILAIWASLALIVRLR